MRPERALLIAVVAAGASAYSACSGEAAAPGIDGVMLAQVPPALLWVAERSLSARRSGPDLTIAGEDFRGRRVTLELRNLPVDPPDPTATRLLTLNDSTDIDVGFAQYRESVLDLFTTTDLGGRGIVEITYLSPSRVAGTFSFLARRPIQSGAQVDLLRSVSNGEFDVRIR